MVHLKGVLVGCLSITIALAFIGFGAYMIVPHYQETSNAKPVDATVLSAEVVETTDAEGNPKYHPDISYEYTYGGETYTCESFFPGGERTTPKGRAEEVVETYSEGRSVTAYVTPDDPSTAYLIDENPPWWYFVLPVVGLFALLLGISKTRMALRGETGPARVELF